MGSRAKEEAVAGGGAITAFVSTLYFYLNLETSPDKIKIEIYPAEYVLGLA